MTETETTTEELTADEAAALARYREKRDREAREVAAAMARLNARREATAQWRERLMDGVYWDRVDGHRMRIEDMTPLHAARALAVVRRSALSFAVVAEEADVEGWSRKSLDMFPTVAALEARAEERPTVVDRLKDKASARRYLKEKAK